MEENFDLNFMDAYLDKEYLYAASMKSNIFRIKMQEEYLPFSIIRIPCICFWIIPMRLQDMILKQKNFFIIIRQSIMRSLIWYAESAGLEMRYGF